MARHSMDIMAKLTVRVPRGFAGFWDVIRSVWKEKGFFTLTDIDGQSMVDRSTVSDYLHRLEKGGYVKHIGNNPDTPNGTKLYKLLKYPLEAPRLRKDGSAVTQGDSQDRMWRSMKMLKKFTAHDLAINASLPKAIVPTITAVSYIKHLLKAEYLRVLEPRYGSKGAIYQLVKFTGPKAPMVQRTNWVWDPNTKEVMGPEAGEK
ncbi:MAG: hypothetical protein R3E60_06955 [Alphaproteobacteria bacterium]